MPFFIEKRRDFPFFVCFFVCFFVVFSSFKRAINDFGSGLRLKRAINDFGSGLRSREGEGGIKSTSAKVIDGMS